MRKVYFRILMVLCPFLMNGQVRIGSISIAPITGTNDIELRIHSYCSQGHSLDNSEFTGTPSGYLVNLCFVDSGLLMPSEHINNIILPNINTTGNQTITINAYYRFYLGPDDPSCTSNPIFSTSPSLTFDAPLTESRMFQLDNASFETKKINLYPNPNNGNFSIDLPENTDNAELSIYDLSGKKVFDTLNYPSGDTIQLKDLSKGVYIAKVIHRQATEILKFVVK